MIGNSADDDVDIDFVEKEMFGGVAFMHNGHMTFGLLGKALMVRVGPNAYEACLNLNRAMRGIITVLSASINAEKRLRKWIDKGLDFTKYLPPE